MTELQSYLEFYLQVVSRRDGHSSHALPSNQLRKCQHNANYPLNEEVQQDIPWQKRLLLTFTGRSVLYKAEWAAVPLVQFRLNARDEFASCNGNRELVKAP